MAGIDERVTWVTNLNMFKVDHGCIFSDFLKIYNFADFE